ARTARSHARRLPPCAATWRIGGHSSTPSSRLPAHERGARGPAGRLGGGGPARGRASRTRTRSGGSGRTGRETLDGLSGRPQVAPFVRGTFRTDVRRTRHRGEPGPRVGGCPMPLASRLALAPRHGGRAILGALLSLALAYAAAPPAA